MRMAQLAGVERLVAEAFKFLRAFAFVGAHDLYGDRAAQPRIVSAPDDAHAALPDNFDQAIRAELALLHVDSPRIRRPCQIRLGRGYAADVIVVIEETLQL